MDLQNVQLDIIIPIYNAYEELCKCLFSVYKWTNLEQHRLILINDNSSDERIKDYLQSLEGKNVIVVHNDKNKGFSANINTGIKQSVTRDVVFLNSDTIVTKEWVNKLIRCAYSDERIATVTPLSNNATLCSVPNFCEENTIPEGYSLEEYAELIEKVSLREYPQIPVANGFCMYVKRSVIAKIGMLDEKTFQRGYGEENDFCYRAIEAGYHHVMCDDTFILHTGTSSFLSEEKRRYIQEHERILDERYPDLMQNVREHCNENPYSFVGENIRFWSTYNKCTKRKRILYMLQSDFREDAENNVGGTQLHVKDLVQGLRKDKDIVVVARNANYINVTLYCENAEFCFKYFVGPEDKIEKYRSRRFNELYKRIIDNFQIDVVHIHHTKGMSLEMFYVALANNIPLYVTLHDYYFICPNIKLLDYNNNVCNGNENEDVCRECLKKTQGISSTVPFLEVWRDENLKVLKYAKKIIVPSQAANEIVQLYFPELNDKIVIIEHGTDFCTERNESSGRDNRKRFNVAFVGGINTAKGYRYAREMIKTSNSSIHWYLFGEFEKKDRILNLKRNFKNVGAYKREELPTLLKKNEIDLVCILPIWPETFCYTISESVLCGVPVLVTDIGALGQRVREMKCGWVVDNSYTSRDILKKIYEIRTNKLEYQKVKDYVKKIQLKSVEEMCEEYKEIYCLSEGLCKEQIEMDRDWILDGLVNAKSGNFKYTKSEWVLREQGGILKFELERITNSISFKIIRILDRNKIPGKGIVKRLLNRILKVRREKKR